MDSINNTNRCRRAFPPGGRTPPRYDHSLSAQPRPHTHTHTPQTRLCCAYVRVGAGPGLGCRRQVGSATPSGRRVPSSCSLATTTFSLCCAFSSSRLSQQRTARGARTTDGQRPHHRKRRRPTTTRQAQQHTRVRPRLCLSVCLPLVRGVGRAGAPPLFSASSTSGPVSVAHGAGVIPPFASLYTVPLVANRIESVAQTVTGRVTCRVLPHRVTR